MVGVDHGAVEADLVQEDLRAEQAERPDVGADLARVNEGVAALVLHEDPLHAHLVEEVDVDVVDLHVRAAQHLLDEWSRLRERPVLHRRDLDRDDDEEQEE